MSCPHLLADQLCPSHLWYCPVHHWERPSLAGQKPFIQSSFWLSDTHLLRSVIKLCKLGRLDTLQSHRLYPVTHTSGWFLGIFYQLQFSESKCLELQRGTSCARHRQIEAFIGQQESSVAPCELIRGYTPLKKCYQAWKLCGASVCYLIQSHGHKPYIFQPDGL